MFAATVTALLFAPSGIVDSCLILNRTDFLREQTRLYKTLFKDYDARLPAVITIDNSSRADGADLPRYNVAVVLSILKLISMDESEQKANFLFEYQMEWQDERIGWTPSEYCGIKHIYVSRQDVWIPEVTIIDAHSSQDYREEYKKFVWVNSTGHMGYFVPTVTATVCAIKTRDFPFDSQHCPVKMMTQSFSAREYGIEAKLSPAMFDLDVREQMNSFEFSIKRNPSFYIAVVITPSFVVNILCIIGLFLRAGNSMAKLGMALTNVMSLTFIYGILASVLPKTDELPKIAIYVVVNLCLIVAALVCVIVLPHVRLRRRTDKIKEKLDEKKDNEDPTICCSLNLGLFIAFELANLTNFLVLVFHSTQDYREDYKKFVTIREFPFDSQQCTIKIMTQLFMPNEYSIEAVLSPQLANSTTVESMGNGEWKVLKVTAQTVIVENPDKSLVEMNTYEFYLKRNPSFYIAVVITPSFVINILCVLGLFLRAESSMSKLGMALTNVMSLTFILGILATVLPKTDELPKIGE
ncbi:unnamed protein product [Heligmosomoides polygyrus]|uniref:Neur_chan_LBD domain-containing protein n=1 Tax=Heligmosomoides polygyrus TaxID=6339 RepID=A0A3P7UBP6_HELPZ|nr:unnamed protein product [Heligmosomoides polygyrus]